MPESGLGSLPGEGELAVDAGGVARDVAARNDGKDLVAAFHALAAPTFAFDAVHLEAGAIGRKAKAHWQAVSYTGIVGQHSMALWASGVFGIFDCVHSFNRVA